METTQFRIEVPRCIGADEFEEELFAELYMHGDRLPLQRFCRDGCPASDTRPELSNLQINPPSASTVTGRFDVWFKEYVHRGCRDFESNEPVTGSIEFTLDLNTGEITLEPHTAPERPPDRF